MNRETFTFRLSRTAKACEGSYNLPNKWYKGDQAYGAHLAGSGQHCCNKGFSGKPVYFDYSGDETRFSCPADEAPKSGLEPCKLNRRGYAVGRTW